MTSQTNLAWLECTVEEPLESNLPICDPHHHLREFRHERVSHRYLLDAHIRAGDGRFGGIRYQSNREARDEVKRFHDRATRVYSLEADT